MNTSQDRKSSVRQNGTYTSSRKHEVNLRRNPTLHFQIGLILALLVSIFFVELRTPEKKLAEKVIPIEDDIIWVDNYVVEKPVTKPKVKVKPVAPTPVEPTELTVVDEKAELEETIFENTEPDVDNAIIPTNEVAVIEEPEDIKVSFEIVEDVPIFPGCEREKTNQARRDCMNSKINKFVRKKFNTGKADGLGLEGVNRIHTLFVIDKTGAIVDIKIKAPHPTLEKEAQRVLDLLPDMTPGKQRNEPVKVQFALPIVFKVED